VKLFSISEHEKTKRGGPAYLAGGQRLAQAEL
jgi:hypothetical protein